MQSEIRVNPDWEDAGGARQRRKDRMYQQICYKRVRRNRVPAYPRRNCGIGLPVVARRPNRSDGGLFVVKMNDFVYEGPRPIERHGGPCAGSLSTIRGSRVDTPGGSGYDLSYEEGGDVRRWRRWARRHPYQGRACCPFPARGVVGSGRGGGLFSRATG
jgi:hypothetical protein